MQIHLYLSDSAPARNRLKEKLQDILHACTVIEHQIQDTLRRTIPLDYNEPVTSVVMVANNRELFQLAKDKLFWGNSKNILIIPDQGFETIKFANDLRPVFITSMNSDFSEVVLILEHIMHRCWTDIQNNQSAVDIGKKGGDKS
jgi:hypothetical protein